MSTLNYKIEVFEGPMDLLLHLISKHKLNIYDIPIVELVEQYLAYVNEMKNHDLEVASEFLEMASRLIYMKTVSLLPKHEEIEELKKELTGELLAFFKEQGFALERREVANAVGGKPRLCAPHGKHPCRG